jgi:hypothetical protein
MTADLMVIVPSRGRPQNIAALHDAWQSTTIGSAQLLIAVDDDDPTLGDYEKVCADRGIDLTVGPRLRMCPTLNKVASERAPHHFAIGFLGDDHRPRTVGWNQTYVDTLQGIGTGIVYGNDLLRGETLPTQVAMTADIVQALGYMVPPGIKHLWADNVWFDLGHAIDRIRYLPDVIVEHLHPVVGKGEWDAGYTEVNSDAANDADRSAYRRWLETQKDIDVAKLKALL